MYIRSVNQSFATQSAQNLSKMAASTSGYGEGNVFVGGTGKIAVANQTEDFICAGGQSQMMVANRGNRAYIQGGAAGNEIFSVGHNCVIYGSQKDDQVFSIGRNCDISLLDGNDRICASGAGTIVDGGDGSDLGSGTLGGLDYNSLFSLNVVAMLAKIQAACKAEIVKWYNS